MSDGRSNKEILYYHSDYLFIDISKITGLNPKTFIRFLPYRIDCQIFGYRITLRLIIK
jgi:hypothetical protein